MLYIYIYVYIYKNLIRILVIFTDVSDFDNEQKCTSAS